MQLQEDIYTSGGVQTHTLPASVVKLTTNIKYFSNMKTLIIILTFLIALTSNGQVHVKGYTKSNGTYVAPHVRSSPNSTPTDNYSYPGNTNPYTGKTATGNVDTYLKNYNTTTISPSSTDVWVDGYYKTDGTYVTGHWRSAPNGDPYDNFSFPGNTNPYTGKTATGNPDTYLNNYYGTSSTTHNYGSTYYVNSNSLNVRSGPSTNYSILTSLGYGDDVEVLESTNENWKKVKISYFDNNSYSTKSTIGYVYSSYLSSSNPTYNSNYKSNINYDKLFNNYSYNSLPSYSNNNTYNSSNVSSSSYSPYGYNKGKITIWTNCSDEGIISIYIDDVYKGQITSYYLESYSPSCGDSGTLNIILTEGTYHITAIGNETKWDGSVTITADECQLKKVSK